MTIRVSGGKAVLRKKLIGPEGEIINLIERKYEWRPLKYPMVPVKRGAAALMKQEKGEHLSITLLKAAIEYAEAEKLLWQQHTDIKVNQAIAETGKWLKEQNKEIENGRYELIDSVNSLSVKHIPSEMLQNVRHDIQKRIDRLDILKLDRITSLGDLTKKFREKRDIIDRELAVRTR
jgi:hypothetical protein